MKHRMSILALSGMVAALGLVASERPASACGGCFVPPESNTVVTDHRMLLSVGQGQSTLYDQIRYQGSPESFAWVLPISGEAEVGLSADTVFSVLDSLTQVGVVAPPRNCPAAPDCDSRGLAGSAQSPNAGSASPEDGVTVTKQEVIGPYETVQLQATNPEALNQWLATNRFTVPDDVKPVVAQYVRENFNFLAMKLIPGASVQAMRPVRVTTRGASVTLPLRMVAAGTGATVGISLWVLGQGRYEPQNFPAFVIKQEELAWDWNANQSNYKTIREERTRASNGRAWELESSLAVATQIIDNGVRNGGFVGRPGPQPSTPGDDYAAIPAANGNPGKTAAEVRDEDLGILLGRVISGAQIRVTRMRADLNHAALSEDLLLTAPADQALLGNTRQVTRELNEPLCPVFSGCDQVGQAPRSEAAAQSASGSVGGGSCSTSNANTSSGALLAGCLAAFGLVLVRSRRSKRSSNM